MSKAIESSDGDRVVRLIKRLKALFLELGHSIYGVHIAPTSTRRITWKGTLFIWR